MTRQFRYDVEISFNIKAKLLVELSLCWFIRILIGIDDLPSLVDLTMFGMHDDIPVFSIKSALNI
jgi:hypothetical protein